MALKAELRQAYLTQRRNIPLEEMKVLSRAIADRFFAKFAPKDGETVHVFLPIVQHHEINTWYIIEDIWQKYPQVQVAVPVADLKDGSMSHFVLTPNIVLEENKWGIPEPVNALFIPESEINTVLVPLLAFDKQGHRVGYGRGFYDRFLALLPQNSQKVGLSVLPPIDRIDDVHPNDLVLDAVITPDRLYSFEEGDKDRFSEDEDLDTID